MYTVSIFLTQHCDNKCIYCYGHSKGEMNYTMAKKVINHLFDMGFRKISFAGGEPLLWTYDLFGIMGYSKSLGMFTELITNGNQLQKKVLQINSSTYDIITIDIDSLKPNVNISLGKSVNHVKRAESLFKEAYKLGKWCKVNTVVTAINKNDVIGLCNWIKAHPAIYRWKLFQFLPSSGRALRNANLLQVSTDEFNEVVEEVKMEMNGWGGEIISEDNTYLSNSYASVDQEGNFYTAVKDGELYKTVEIGKVLDMTIDDFLNCSLINRDRFLERSMKNCKKMMELVSK